MFRMVRNPVATIRPHGKGFRAEVARLGVRRSKVCATKREARDWAARVEAEILSAGGIAAASASMTVAQVMERYAREVSPRKRGERWEIVRLNSWRSLDWARKAIGSLTADDIARWRDARLDQVTPGTVRRDMALLSAVLSTAVKPWGLLRESPIKDVRKPRPPGRRKRLVTADELARLEVSAGTDMASVTARTFAAFRLACATGMRAGEILALTWDHVDLARRVVHLPRTKNGDARDVPLSREAVGILEALQGRGGATVFDIEDRARDALWRKLRDRAGVTDLTFHDSRHYAVTQLSKRLPVLDLARMIGHRNINELLTYYEASAEDMAQLLD